MTQVKVSITKDILFKTQNCINNKYLATNCAIAVAINQLIPNCWITPNQIFVFKEGSIKSILNDEDKCIFDFNAVCTIKLPLQAQQFVIDFDDNTAEKRLLMDEISFNIEVPDEALENIDISDVFKHSKTLELV